MRFVSHSRSPKNSSPAPITYSPPHCSRFCGEITTNVHKVKRLDDGVFSRFANESLKAGDMMEVMPPMGRFGVGDRAASARTYVGFAAGSGITPILSIVKTVLKREPESRFVLFYGNRSSASIIF